jgi:4-amino-4-deoxy-L-arabinose transferase-like glycosyltransferase
MKAKGYGSTGWVVAMLVVVVLFRLACMAWVPLMDTTEARYAEIGRKMLASGDWTTPWLGSLPFWGKPPLSFWLTATSFMLFGINEFAARLPHFLCLVVVAWLCWTLAARRSRSEAWMTVAMLAGAALFFVSAGAVMTDAALTVGTTLAMRGFWLHVSRPAGTDGRYQWQLFLGLSIGLLAKGPLAVVLLAMPVLAWSLATRRSGDVWRDIAWIRGLLAALLLAAPWYIAAEVKTPGFLEYFIAGEHWHRFVTPGWKGDLYGHAHEFPLGTIWVFAMAATMPWSILLPVAWARWPRGGARSPGDEQERNWRLYLACCSLAPIVFFTLARNIIWTYALPALPAFALLAATWLRQRSSPDGANGLIAAGLAITIAGSLAYGVHLYSGDAFHQKSAKALVAEWYRLRKGEEPLVFVGSRPYSASFYSDGQAELAPTALDAKLLLGERHAFVAVELGRTSEFRSPGARELGRFGGYDLFEVGEPVREAVSQ